MKRILFFIIYIQISLLSYTQIIADHTVVDKYDEIPQEFIDEVKKMWLSYPGESHSEAIRDGLEALEGIDGTYQVNVTEEGTPEAYTTSHLRASSATWGSYSVSSGWVYSYGTYSWFVQPLGISRTKAGIDYCNSNNLTIGALGFGWCWDSEIDSPTEFQQYINATQEYVDYCTANNIDTHILFTTGTVDGGEDTFGETGYDKYLGYEQIRDYVADDNNLVLFDYADILCYNDAGQVNTTSWSGHTYPIIHPDNEDGGYTGHIGMNGAVRLAKAMWWMLARVAGWDGGTTNIPVENITVSGVGGLSSITTDKGTLQLTADVSPSDASNKTVTWSIINGSGQATISSTGLVTAVSSGTVKARATANDGSGVYGELEIIITNQIILVEDIVVTGAGGLTTISTDNGTLQLSADILPEDATNQNVSWSVTNGTGEATISSTGLVRAVENGTVTARATANDGSGVYGTLEITISNQIILVTQIDVSGAGGATSITSTGATLQLYAEITPANATDHTVTWSIINGTGEATISSTGLVTAVEEGTVTARATANDGSDIYGQMVITINGDVILVSDIIVTGAGGSSTISSNNGTLQLYADILPVDATNQNVTWSLTNGTGEATISSTGRVAAIDNGTVTARATAKDGSGVYGELVITISNQIILVTNIAVSGASGSSAISSDNGTLQLTATVSPSNATNQTVTWTIINGTGQATISSSGLVTAIDNGTVTARATANDGSGIYGQLVITIAGQFIPVTGITVNGAGGSSAISTDSGTLQLSATISPSNATYKTVIWSIINNTGQAGISSTGLVTAVSNGTVTARATATDGTDVYGEIEITISNQLVPVTEITINGTGGLTSITEEGGTLQLFAVITPVDATDQTVTWSVINGTGQATISSTGLLTAISEGAVTVMASANDGSGISSTLEITIAFNQVNDFRVIVREGYIEVLFNEDHTGYHLKLYDLMGNMRQKEIIDGNSCQLNSVTLTPGVYLVVLSTSVIYEVRKVMIAK